MGNASAKGGGDGKDGSVSGVDARPRGYSSTGSRKSEGNTETEPRRGSNPRPISTGVPTQAIDVTATQPMGVKKHVPYKRPKGTSTSDGEDENDKDDGPSARGDDSQKSSNGTSGKVGLDDFEVRISPHRAQIWQPPIPRGTSPATRDFGEVGGAHILPWGMPLTLSTQNAQPLKVIGNGCFGKVSTPGAGPKFARPLTPHHPVSPVSPLPWTCLHGPRDCYSQGWL